jgi:tRNA-2-methylthio-N6-dimethylallyladenosine synthase
MPTCAISTDIIAGFCGETEEDHSQTLSIIDEVGFDMAFMFKYSERPKTLASRKYADDVPEEVKGRRLQEVIDAQRKASSRRLATYVGQEHEVLIEGVSKRSTEHVYGRNSQNSIVIVPRYAEGVELMPGVIVRVAIEHSTAGSLKGRLMAMIEQQIA